LHDCNLLTARDDHVRFTNRTFKDFKLLERDPQIPGLMAFERPVQALLEQFVQGGLGRAFGLLGFSFPKHTLLLLDGNCETQV
jgi:hypothetical protein